MRPILIIFIFGIALVSSQDSNCSDEFKRLTEFLESRLQLFGEALNDRLEGFENRLTQSECSRKSTICDGRSQTIDYGSRARSIIDDIIEIYDARIRERKSISSYTNQEKNGRQELKLTTEMPESIQNRVKDALADLHILREISETETIPEYIKSILNQLNAKRAKESTTENAEDSTDSIPLEEYRSNEESTTLDSFSTESTSSDSSEISTETAWKPTKINIDVLIQQYLAWNRTKEQSDEKSTTGSTSTEDLFTGSSSTESTSFERIPDNDELESTEDVFTYILNKYGRMKKDGQIRSDTTKTESVQGSMNSVMENFNKWKELEKERIKRV
ncbi:uncharacterized protein LOC108033689 [Drosophila biarmipes]|uniref:uncharacterized protein LOC108033689 n=1 Tax=Drosophila biarmipes TaxID=125945 RepID=UPI0007E82731|nr:uncharacterized protein LOC108033689 [Drosophila biarmipes]